jgi:N-hydroxyarylamine O-acetyltransferase
MADGFDLDAYLKRIGFRDRAAPDLATLSAIHALQPDAIPFENLDPLLRRPVSLDLASLQAKLVAGKRGGYCFEQNSLLAAALDAIGFKLTRLAGRVRWRAAPGAPDGPRNHMLLRVDLPEGSFLVDAGFGGFVLGAPLKLLPDIEQDTAGGRHRLLEKDGTFTLQVRLPAGWQDAYRFTLDPQNPADYVVANWFTSTHPAVLFYSNLLAERVTPAFRATLFNRKLTTRRTDGAVEEKTLEDAAELGAVLEGLFGIAAPAEPQDIWDRLPSG